MDSETKASRLPGDDAAPATRDYSGRSGADIQGNDSLLRLHKPEGIKRMAEELAGGPETPLREFTLKRDDNRPLRFQGRLVGHNDTDAAAPRGTSVNIFITKRGKIVTSVRQWQRDAKRERERYAAAPHDKAEEALAWLIDDGRGVLGSASRQAWERACEGWPALKGYEVEVVE